MKTHVADIIPGFLDILCGVPVSGRCSQPYPSEEIIICFISGIIRYNDFYVKYFDLELWIKRKHSGKSKEHVTSEEHGRPCSAAFVVKTH